MSAVQLHLTLHIVSSGFNALLNHKWSKVACGQVTTLTLLFWLTPHHKIKDLCENRLKKINMFQESGILLAFALFVT